jgi:hypothetical protein
VKWIASCSHLNAVSSRCHGASSHRHMLFLQSCELIFHQPSKKEQRPCHSVQSQTLVLAGSCKPWPATLTPPIQRTPQQMTAPLSAPWPALCNRWKSPVAASRAKAEHQQGRPGRNAAGHQPAQGAGEAAGRELPVGRIRSAPMSGRPTSASAASTRTSWASRWTASCSAI